MKRIANKKEKRLLLKEQNGLCYYCSQEIGSTVEYKRKYITLQAELDHIVPFSFCYADNKTNFVVSCHICNRLKGSKIFNSMADLLTYLQQIWLNGGYKCNVKNVVRSFNPKEDGKSSAVENAEILGTINRSTTLSVHIAISSLTLESWIEKELKRLKWRLRYSFG